MSLAWQIGLGSNLLPPFRCHPILLLLMIGVTLCGTS